MKSIRPQGGGLQKEAFKYHLTIGYQVCDVVPKKNLRTRSRKFISTAKQRKARNIVHNPDMGASDNRHQECSNIRGIYYGEKVG
jgi:hypothetical protein